MSNTKSLIERKTELEKVIDEAIEESQFILKQFNPCRIEKKMGCTTCFSVSYIKSDSFKENTLCCIDCKHHSIEIGCTAKDPLYCRTWLCFVSPIRDSLIGILEKAQSKGIKIPHNRATREEILEESLK